ncbi:cytochrome c peroxidase [Variovorax sp. J31P179]|uniref:cytochrome-c peroxidase n=1 Tax=Variovorax sp. J31P179 TaxID=3053508 RepID=UPI0025784253|nr:cytochrome c peroxidase [Variovorax sp. J31P179]MDM0084037.1 cytochrome c peroxidase [Variovorax sp. J31P179]
MPLLFPSFSRFVPHGLTVLLAMALVGCERPAPQAAAATPATAPVPAYVGATYAPVPGRPQPGAAQLTALGRRIFFDASLSASGTQSCASCHDPRHAYGPPNALSVQLGGADGRTPGPRASPSLRYLQTLAAFSEHHHDNDGDDSIDAGPTGGHMWDGRADSAHAQAALPLLSAAEMANASIEEVAHKLARAAYADELRAAFGDDLFQDDAAAFRAASLALEVFQQSPADFYPFTSKFDGVLRGQLKLDAAEARGLKLFNAPDKGNCAACHISERTPDGAFPLFTDFGMIAIGVPRHRGLAANADPDFHDLGLCGPIRTDLRDHPEYCGLFRTPSLRNVALRQAFFHNGVFHSLEEAVRFYAQRDSAPGRWYGRDARGRTVPFDDLPAQYHGNVNTEPPFGQHRGDRPALSEAEIRDVVAFLKTLTDADQLPPSNSTSASISTGMSKGSSARPTALRAWAPTSGP